MFTGYVFDDEARAWEKRIQDGKTYREVHQRLLQRSLTDESCVPTIPRMAQELHLSEKETRESRDYAFNELAEDEIEFIRFYSSGFLDLDTGWQI